MTKLIGDAEAKIHQKSPITKPNDGMVKLGVWVRKEVHQRLMELRIEKNAAIQQIMTEALDMWLVDNGEPTIDELTKGEGNNRKSMVDKRKKQGEAL